MHQEPIEYSLPDIKWEFNDFEPILSGDSLIVHVLSLHKGYIDRMNSWAKTRTDIFSIAPSQILSNLSDHIDNEDRQFVLDNLGGHVAHTLFWKTIAPSPKINIHNFEDTELSTAYSLSAEKLKQDILNASLKRVGSGWLWLAIDMEGNLRTYTTLNHNTPCMRKQVPIMCIDLWEHAYYLDYLSNRREWLEAIIEKIDFEQVDKNYLSVSKSHYPFDEWCFGG